MRYPAVALRCRLTPRHKGVDKFQVEICPPPFPNTTMNIIEKLKEDLDVLQATTPKNDYAEFLNQLLHFTQDRIEVFLDESETEID